MDQSIQSQTETLPPPVVTEISDLQTESTTSRIEKLKKEERIRTTELSEIKKHMNNLINRRAMVISSRYEGANQDEKLRKLGSYIDQIEQEISRVQNAMKKNRNGKTHTSSALVENNSMMPAEKLLAKLSKELESTKEKVRPLSLPSYDVFR